MRYLRVLVPAFLVMAAMVTFGQPAAARETVRLVAVIDGAGLSTMDEMGNFRGPTAFTITARLYSDGSATGWIDCADLAGSFNPLTGGSVEGDVAGPVTSWTRVNGKIALHGTLTLAGTGGAVVLATTVTVQKFGGAGKGHWTMSLPAIETPGGPPTCSEAITSGRLDITRYDWQD
jgi:hypothetical protein